MNSLTLKTIREAISGTIYSSTRSPLQQGKDLKGRNERDGWETERIAYVEVERYYTLHHFCVEETMIPASACSMMRYVPIRFRYLKKMFGIIASA